MAYLYINASTNGNEGEVGASEIAMDIAEFVDEFAEAANEMITSLSISALIAPASAQTSMEALPSQKNWPMPRDCRS
jgi:hypothetical protein